MRTRSESGLSSRVEVPVNARRGPITLVATGPLLGIIRQYECTSVERDAHRVRKETRVDVESDNVGICGNVEVQSAFN